MDFIKLIRNGQAVQATNLIEKLLKTKVKNALNEERSTVVSDVYGTVDEAIENPNSSGQGHDASHSKNPYHDTMLKHGYKYSHSTPVTVGGNKQIAHAYKHGSLKDHVAGVRETGSGHKWEVHKLGSGSGYSGGNAASLDKHLKGHVARATKKAAKK